MNDGSLRAGRFISRNEVKSNPQLNDLRLFNLNRERHLLLTLEETPQGITGKEVTRIKFLRWNLTLLEKTSLKVARDVCV